MQAVSCHLPSGAATGVERDSLQQQSTERHIQLSSCFFCITSNAYQIKQELSGYLLQVHFHQYGEHLPNPLSRSNTTAQAGESLQNMMG